MNRKKKGSCIIFDLDKIANHSFLHINNNKKNL